MMRNYLEFASLMESFGITDRRFIAPLYSQLCEADGFGGDGLEFAAAVIKGIKPNDQLEAMRRAGLTRHSRGLQTNASRQRQYAHLPFARYGQR
jgi:hypothetical protein